MKAARYNLVTGWMECMWLFGCWNDVLVARKAEYKTSREPLHDSECDKISKRLVQGIGHKALKECAQENTLPLGPEEHHKEVHPA